MIGGFFDAIRDGLQAAVQVVIDAFGAVINAVFSAWPFGMPAFPTIPDGVLTALGWIVWTVPLTMAAILGVTLFLLSVWIAVAIGGPILRWAKVLD